MDAAGKFGLGHNLADKVLWGSDVPMVISDKSYRKGRLSSGDSEYRHYIQSFIDTVASSQLPPANKTILIEKMTETNPKKFLRIQ